MYNNNDKDQRRFFPKFYVLEEELIFSMCETKASDYYLTITEKSKKFTNDDERSITKTQNLSL